MTKRFMADPNALESDFSLQMSQIGHPVGTIISSIRNENELPGGWIKCHGRSIGRTGSVAHHAGDHVKELYRVIWGMRVLTIAATDPFRISSAPGASWEADWNANRTITINFALPSTGGCFLRQRRSEQMGVYEADRTKKNGLAVTAGACSLTGTTSFAATNHRHLMRHTHRFLTIGSNWDIYALPFSNRALTRVHVTDGATRILWDEEKYASGTNRYATESREGSRTFWTSGVTNAESGSGDTARTAQPSPTASVGISYTAQALGNGDTETKPHSISLNHYIKY